MRRFTILLPLLFGGCGAGSETSSANENAPSIPSGPPTEFRLSLRVVDEAGLPLAAATVELDGAILSVDVDGRLSLPGRVEPATLALRAAGFLSEPRVLGREEAWAEQVVRLRAALGPGGTPRVAIHIGGAAMLGRRFTAPVQPDTHVVQTGDGGVSARAAVASLAPLFRAADLRVANLESVIGNLPESGAYPGKRYLFCSVPEIVQALQDLGLDVASLANDHARDWLEPGLAGTLAALGGAGISTAGAGLTDVDAALPAVVDVGGLKVGILAYSSVWGNYVNDAYPDEAAPVPSPLDPEDVFQYEVRTWGYLPDIPVLPRRIRTAWQAVEDAEAAGVDRAALWASASAVYPELQDWVARRGHGGANPTSSSRLPLEIAALRAAGCALVLVTTHHGHEFAEAASESAVRYAREAVDAGADLVVHFARVPQGFEFYKGKLICLGLGNLVSDQDLLDSFLSGVLRVVFEGGTMIEARFLPITLLRYRPAPLAGRLAGRALRLVQERSSIEASTRLVDGEARAQIAPRPSGATAAAFTPDRNAALLTPWTGAAASLSVTAGFEQPADLPATGLLRSRGPGGAALPGVLFGRDLLRWGYFEDEVAEGLAAGGPQWDLFGASLSAGVPVAADAPSGERVLHLTRGASNNSRVRLHPVSAVPTPAHRLWDPLGPADGPAAYSLRFQARRDGTGESRFTLEVYGAGHRFLRAVDLAFDVPADGGWHEAWVDVPASVFASSLGLDVEAVILHVGLHPPASGVSALQMDDLRFVEWRSPNLQPDGYYEVDSVRSTVPGTSVTAVLERRAE